MAILSFDVSAYNLEKRNIILAGYFFFYFLSKVKERFELSFADQYDIRIALYYFTDHAKNNELNVTVTPYHRVSKKFYARSFKVKFPKLIANIK